MKFSLLCITLALASITCFGQNNDPNPNQAYENFSMAYETLDAGIISETYAENAVLLNLYDGSNPSSIKGAAAIKDFFATFFKQFKERGQKLELSFKLIERQKIGKTIYDNGYYKLSITTDGRLSHTGYGKLSALLIFDGGSWKFSIDSNTNTSKEEFENAVVNEVVQPE